MAASSSKGTSSRVKMKNVEMAARMKREGITRNTMRCPMCHKSVAIKSIFQHLGKC